MDVNPLSTAALPTFAVR